MPNKISYKRLFVLICIIVACISLIVWIICYQKPDLQPAKIVSAISQIIAMYFTFDGLRRLSLDAGASGAAEIFWGGIKSWLYPNRSLNINSNLKGITCHFEGGSVQAFHFGTDETPISKRFLLIEQAIRKNADDTDKVRTQLSSVHRKIEELDKQYSEKFIKVLEDIRESEKQKNHQAVKDGFFALFFMFVSCATSLF